MKELMDDVEALLESNPGGDLDDIIVNGGGVLQIESINEIPEQFKTPCLGISDGGIVAQHWSSGVKWLTMTVVVTVFVRIFDQLEKVKGREAVNSANRSAADLARVVRNVLDMDRMGKYARAFYKSEQPVQLLKQDQNEFFLSKSLSFEYVRAEP